jgi:hypothetical protein
MSFKRVMVIKWLVICVLMASFSISTADANNTVIHIAKGKYWDFYHIKFTLTPENTLLVLEGYDKYGPSEYDFTDGLFQVFIPKDRFPIPAPNCKGYIILRMPMTLDNAPQKGQYVAEKKVLYDKIKEMKKSGKGQVDVVIELNDNESDIKVIAKDPLKVEMKGANVFFRDAHGRYVNYVGDLKK